MSAANPFDSTQARPSQLIAEALVGRHGPSVIAARATRLGLPHGLTRVMLAACCSTAVDASHSPKRRLVATLR